MDRALVIALAFMASACAKAPVAEGTADTAPDGCPKDLLAARGTPCRSDGKTCSGGVADSRRLLMCSGGRWSELNVPPGPTKP